MPASDMQSYRKIAEEKRAEADDAYRVKVNHPQVKDLWACKSPG